MKRMDPKDQFSKKLAKWSAWFWFAYMTMILAAIVIQPLSADAAIYLAAFTSAVMVLNIGAYTRNSIYDKAIAAGAKVIGRFRFTWKRPAAGAETENDEAEDFSEDSSEDFSEDEPEGEPEDEESGENG